MYHDDKYAAGSKQSMCTYISTWVLFHSKWHEYEDPQEAAPFPLTPSKLAAVASMFKVGHDASFENDITAVGDLAWVIYAPTRNMRDSNLNTLCRIHDEYFRGSEPAIYLILKSVIVSGSGVQSEWVPPLRGMYPSQTKCTSKTCVE